VCQEGPESTGGAGSVRDPPAPLALCNRPFGRANRELTRLSDLYERDRLTDQEFNRSQGVTTRADRKRGHTGSPERPSSERATRACFSTGNTTTGTAAGKRRAG
jgi:hypothetical protein